MLFRSRTVAQQKKATNSVIQRRKRTLQRLDHALSARIDSLLKGYEQETLLRAREEAEYQKAVRHRSATIISGIAAGAVVLSVIFLVMIWPSETFFLFLSLILSHRQLPVKYDNVYQITFSSSCSF